MSDRPNIYASDAAREAAAKAYDRYQFEKCTEEGRGECHRNAISAAIDAFLAKSLEGADEKLAEIRERNGKEGFAVSDRATLLTLVTALSAKLKEVEAARASQMEEGDHPKDCRCEVCRAWGA